MPALPPALEAAVERHWRAVAARRPVFNGRVFSADRVTPERIEGHWTEYRRAVAQFEEPGLRGVLGINSLAVCGILCCRDGVVAGRREPAAIYQPGMWQLPPAGSVDVGAAREGGASWRRALLAELREELGLEEGAASRLLPLCLVQHPVGVLDIGVQIDTALSGAEIAAAHRERGNGEYDRLLVAPSAEVAAHVATLGGKLVRSALIFLEKLGRA